jgi:transcriptional regulator with XRE-family HTH domain
MQRLTRADLRRRAGLTQVRLARLTGINPTQICLWERGDIELLDSDVSKIARTIETELGRLPQPSAAHILTILSERSAVAV